MKDELTVFGHHLSPFVRKVLAVLESATSSAGAVPRPGV